MLMLMLLSLLPTDKCHYHKWECGSSMLTKVRDPCLSKYTLQIFLFPVHWMSGPFVMFTSSMLILYWCTENALLGTRQKNPRSWGSSTRVSKGSWSSTMTGIFSLSCMTFRSRNHEVQTLRSERVKCCLLCTGIVVFIEYVWIQSTILTRSLCLILSKHQLSNSFSFHQYIVHCIWFDLAGDRASGSTANSRKWWRLDYQLNRVEKK